MKKNENLAKNILLIVMGGLIGATNGLFGGGGGMLCVPVLQHILKKSPKQAHATAILVILPITVASAIIYMLNGYFDIANGALTGGGVLAGGALGAILLSKLKNNVVTVIFAVVMIVAGVRMAVGAT